MTSITNSPARFGNLRHLRRLGVRVNTFIAGLALLRAAVSVSHAALNLVPNGNFETAGGASWAFAGGGATIDYLTTGGNGGGGFADMNSAAGWGVIVARVSPTEGLALPSLGLAAGGNYTFSLDMKSLGAGGVLAGIKLEGWNAGAKVSDSGDLKFNITTNWATYTTNWTIPASATSIMFVPLSVDGGRVGFDNVGVIVPNTPLAVAISSPVNGATVTSNFTISATATVSPGTVTNVAFYDGVNLLANDVTSPFNFAVNGASPGAHTLKAIARDSFGNSATSSVVSITVSNVLVPVGWQLAWSDEFTQPNGTLPDASKWGYEIGGGGWGNAELQTYTSRTNNVRIENDQLVIEARAETFTGTDHITRNYTSARLTTANKWAWTYGRMEARIKVPRTQGIWPAFWMLGTNIGAVGWPTCGEIDIMENIGREPKIVHGTIHGPGYSGGGGVSGAYTNGPDLADDFHIYAVEWTTNQIKWFFDSTNYFTVTPANIGGNTWVFDHNHYFLLNVAVGGQWPGNPDGTTVLPQRMLVDYVRVYTNAPACVPPAAPTAGHNGPLWMGMTLNLTASTVPGATYNWTGPNGFNSTNQNPSIVNASTNSSGQFSVTASAGGCTSVPAVTTVLVNPPAQIAAQTLSGNIILSWPGGTLQSATNVNGLWSDVMGATSPRTNAIAALQEFYRIRLQ